MGACCSCHRGQKFESIFVEDLEEEKEKQKEKEKEKEKKNENEFKDEEIILRGDLGSHIRHQGSSKFVSMFSQQGKKGTNQDAMTVWEDFAGEKDMFFCGVFDGHGPSGHNVAQYVRDLLPSKLSSSSKRSSISGNVVADNGDESSNNAGKGDNCDNEDSKSPFFSSWKPRILESFKEMDDELEGDAQIESYCSGTTTVAVLKQGDHLIVANLGDSRAVLCTRNDKDQLVAEQITVDLKPNVPSEAERIESCQGRVKAMDEEPNIYRIWMPDEDCPGLAMARAFGDFCLKDFGVISTPELFYRKLTTKDEFIVLATDGVWDVLSNDEVVAVVASAEKRSMAAKMLVDRAVKTWKYKYPLAKVDDCAVVCLFFKRQRPKLTKSYSEVTQLSLNYSELGAHGNNMRTDDGLDTVLNCNLRDSPEDASAKVDQLDNSVNRSRRHRVRNKRRSAKRLESVES